LAAFDGAPLSSSSSVAFLLPNNAMSTSVEGEAYLGWREARRCCTPPCSYPTQISANQRRYAHLSSELPLPLLSRRLLWFLFWHLLLGTCTKSAELALPGQSAGFAQSVRTVLRRRTSCCRLCEMEASQCSRPLGETAFAKVNQCVAPEWEKVLA
jgi:hypothetical protein